MRRVVLVAASVVIALAVAEVGLQLVDRAQAGGRQPLATRLPADNPPVGASVTLGAIIRPSPNPDLVYELRPLLDVVFHRVRVVTDADGRRVADRSPRPGTATRCLVGLGDSVMFGWGVPFEDTFLARVGAALGPEWEVVNLAVPGYNTVMEAARLENDIGRLKPAVVVLQVIANDLRVPPFLARPPAPRGLRSSALWRRLHRLVTDHDRSDGMIEPWTATLAPANVDPELDNRYRAMIGTAGFELGVRRIATAASSAGATVVVLLADDRGEPWAELAAIVRRHGLRAVPTVGWFSDELVRRGLARGHDEWRRTFWLSDADPHPNPVGHRVLAEGLLRVLAEVDAGR